MNTVESNFTPRIENLSGDNQSEDLRLIPVLPKATSLLFNSGNVVSSDRLKKRTNLNPQEELNEVLNNTFSSWISSIDRAVVKECKHVECRHPEFYEKIDPSEKNDISVSVKIFLNSFDLETFDQAIKKILDEIGIDRIDTLILSFPDKIFNLDELPKEIILPIWTAVQNNIKANKITTAGLADFNAKYLEELINLLEDKNQKPSLNQVNLTSCCKMPEELVEFAKINNIQLTTHIDPREVLTIDNLQSNIRKHAHDYDSHGWVHLWVARYTTILKGRGIVKSKGYIINAQRELKYTK